MKLTIILTLIITSTSVFGQGKIVKTPINEIKFDKIIAFNFNLPDDTSYVNYVDHVIVNGKPNAKLIKPGKILNSEQQKKLISVLSDTSTYGGNLMACFEPRLTYIFYNKDKIIGHIDVCFECNQIQSSIYIPAYTSMSHKVQHGFSEKGAKELLKLCSDLNMIFCIKEE